MSEREEKLFRSPAEQMTSLEILRQLERLERQVAQLQVEGGRWRILAVSALREFDQISMPNGVSADRLDTIMNQIREESTR